MKLKIEAEHIEYMRDKIQATLDRSGDVGWVVSRYENGLIPNADKVTDLQKRFCFDLLRDSDLIPYVCTTIYPYANDDHLYSALKTICPKVTKRY